MTTTKHSFILAPSTWLGEGRIRLNMVDEELAFYTRWDISNRDPSGKIDCTQEIQVKGLSDIMINQFSFYELSPTTFTIDLENQALGRITGSGLINDKIIAWEFRIEDIGFEGFEFYEVQPDNSYLMHAEYATSDQFRTLIQGKVWKQAASQKGEKKAP